MSEDATAQLAYVAARWQRAHESTATVTLLTRDLRSMTAQLRTACGYAWHLSDRLLAASHLDRGPQMEHQLKALLGALGEASANSARVARSWQRRLSDISGQSAAPGEVAFLELAASFNGVARRHDRLLRSEELVPDGPAASRLVDALDELVYSAERVGRLQEHAVGELIGAGRLYVPIAVLVRCQPKLWVVARHPECFTELTDAVKATADALLDASTFARELAGTADHLRPACEYQSGLPASACDPPLARREEVAVGIESSFAQEFGGLDR
jgi:hypothetical protein